MSKIFKYVIIKHIFFFYQATQTDNPLRTATAKVDVQVLDVNDNAPEFEYELYNITVMENLPPGFTVVQVSAFDEDSVRKIEHKVNFFRWSFLIT